MTAVDQIVRKFDQLLRRELGDNYQTVVELNKTSGQVCHAHDYCDANEVMLQAFTQVMGYEPEILEDYSDPTIAGDHDMMEAAYAEWRKMTA